METLTYVTLATSKDKTRHNLTKVYRDSDKLIATDGHRMHWIEGLPHTAGAYLDGSTDCQFPDYSQVMPKGKPVHVFTMFPHVNTKNVLGALLKLVECHDKASKTVELRSSGATMTLAIPNPEDIIGSVKLSGTLEENAPCGGIVLGVNLAYLIDAIAPALKDKSPTSFFTLEFRSEFEPIKVRCHVAGQDYHAIVMPVRL